ncbi:MAG TPA: MoxR family ATPase [Lachnospiraceae bacterium]|nr:MoxR family ATPase [Lachnospiraceae bacterium]
MNYVEKANQIITSLGKIIIGKQETVTYSIITLLSEGHLLLEDVPGVGKTTLAKSIAAVTGCEFSRIQFTPDTLPSDVTGITMYQMDKGSFTYIKGSVMSNIVLADEINRTSPKTQASLLEAMEEKQVTVDGTTHKLPAPFMVIATQNPSTYLGTYHLPEAQMDRFFMRLSLGYPSNDAEKEMAHLYLTNENWKRADAITDATEIAHMQKEVSQVFVHEDIISYILGILDKTRNHEYIKLGISPRAMLALIRGSQARAYLTGRDHVIPEDTINLLKPMLLHRMILTNDAYLGQMTNEKILDAIRCSVKVPLL